MKIQEIEKKWERLYQPKITGKDEGLVRNIRTSLFHARMLVLLATLAFAIKLCFVIYFMTEMSYDQGKFLLTQLVPLIIFLAAYCLARLILSHLHLRYGEMDFEVEIEGSEI